MVAKNEAFTTALQQYQRFWCVFQRSHIPSDAVETYQTLERAVLEKAPKLNRVLYIMFGVPRYGSAYVQPELRNIMLLFCIALAMGIWLLV